MLDDERPGHSGFTQHVLLSSSTQRPITAQAVLEVTKLDDVVDANDGFLSLREAVIQANETAGPDTITFVDALRGGTIRLELGNLVVTDDLRIDGSLGDIGSAGIILAGSEERLPAVNKMFRVEGAALTLEDMTLREARSGSFEDDPLVGGVVIEAEDAVVSLARTAFVDNDIGQYSYLGTWNHLLFAVNSTLNIDQTTIHDNTFGAAIRAIGSTVNLSDSHIQDSVDSNVVIRLTDSRLTAKLSSIANNSTYGRAIVAASSDVLMDGVTVSGNRSVEGQDVIGIFGASQLEMVNSTVANNSGRYGIIYLGTDSIGTINNSTIASNGVTDTDLETAVFLTKNALSLELNNSIVVDNSASTTHIGDLVSNGANIFSDVDVAGAAPTDRQGIDGGQVFATGFLADNGGPTRTVALLNDSANPAIDAADPDDAPATDQRGFARVGLPDIGAYEVQMPIDPDRGLVVTTLVDEVDGNGLVSLREAILTANATAGLDTVSFADGIDGTIGLTLGGLAIRDDVIILGGDNRIVVDGGERTTAAAPVGSVFDVRAATASLADLTITGGPIGIDADASVLTLDRMVFRDMLGDAVHEDGDAFAIRAPRSTVTMRDSLIDNVRAVADGYATGIGDVATLGIESSTITTIDGYRAAGIDAGRATLRDSFIANVSGDLEARAVDIGYLILERSTVTGSRAREVFGILTKQSSISDSTISDHRSTDPVNGRATGLEVIGDLALSNSTIAGNWSPPDPTGYNSYAFWGGIQLSRGYATLINNTIVDNGPFGLGLTAQAGALIVNNLILGNETDVALSRVAQAEFRDNIIGDRDGITPGQVFATGLLADNGGPTKTIALLIDPANPARNAADPDAAPATDQRGFLRDATPDIGAVELDASGLIGLIVTTLADVVDASDGLLSLREAIDLANQTAGEHEIIFADAISGGTIELASDLPTITDDLVIDGDLFEGGAGGIVIDGALIFDESFQPVSGAYSVLRVTNATVRLEDLTVTGGETGIESDGSDLLLVRVAIDDNTQADPLGGAGIGIDFDDGFLLLADSSVSGNGGEGGAGIRFTDSLVEIDTSTIADNGGGLSLGHGIIGSGTLLIATSTLANNGSYFGISVVGDLRLSNSTVVGNGDVLNAPYGPTGSGGVEVTGDGQIVHSTITGNDGTAVVLGDTATYLRIANSIIDGAVSGQFSSNGANIFTGPTIEGAVPGDVIGASTSDLFATGSLADNGGPTQTIALLDDPTNPGLDAADPSEDFLRDQRGFFRDATPDIGAFELGAGPAQPEAPPLPDLGEKVPLADADILGVPRSFLTLVGNDAEISFVDEYAAFQSSLGVYLIGPDGLILSTAWAFERIEHAEPSELASDGARPGGGPLSPGADVLLNDLFDPAELAAGTEFGLFLVADGWSLNPATVFEGGTLAFRSGGDAASVTDRTPELVHIAADGTERLVLGDIMHTVDAGSPNPLSNTLNPGGTGQVTSGLLDGQFVVAFEDKPLDEASDRDFNDALFAVDLFDGEAALVAATAGPVAPAASLETLLVAAETVA